MAQSTTIAVVDDDPEICALVKGLLDREGFDAAACDDGRDLDRLMARRRIDLVVLDLMLPGEDGLAICQRLRREFPDTSILVVTAKGDDIGRIVGLEIGVDDAPVWAHRRRAEVYSPPSFSAHCRNCLVGNLDAARCEQLLTSLGKRRRR